MTPRLENPQNDTDTIQHPHIWWFSPAKHFNHKEIKKMKASWCCRNIQINAFIGHSSSKFEQVPQKYTALSVLQTGAKNVPNLRHQQDDSKTNYSTIKFKQFKGTTFGQRRRPRCQITTDCRYQKRPKSIISRHPCPPLSVWLFSPSLLLHLACFWFCRLPILQGGTFTLLAPSMAMLSMPEWSCPAWTQNASLVNTSSPEFTEVWQSRMRAVSPAADGDVIGGVCVPQITTPRFSLEKPQHSMMIATSIR